MILLGMLVPLYLLGQPSSGGGDAGGRLSEMRVKFNIAESDLGEISPASETMKLASLGLRGVAATLLWNKAHEYRVMHEWDRLKAALNNIALLQPHYDKVWEHQAHNLAYNVSIEFDDYRQRYEMVREGTEFLTRGVRQNRNAPRLVWYTGWFYGQKMGVSDEKVQFRRLFADDDVLHESLMDEQIPIDSPDALGPFGKPDNWLVGRLWLERGYGLVDSGVKIRRQTPLNFYETGPKWRIKHAEAIEDEGVLNAKAKSAWELASKAWEDFGKRSIPTLLPFTVKLGQLEELENLREEKLQQFRELTKEAYDAAVAEKVAELPVDVKKVYERAPEERTEAGKEQMKYIAAMVRPDLGEVAKNSDPSVRLKAVSLIGEMKDLSERHNKTRGYRDQINFDYWETLAQAEQEDRTLEARKLIYDAEKAITDAELFKATELFEKAFVQWAEIFDDYPVLVIDDTADDLFESIRHYMNVIDSEDLPENFPLYTFATMMRDYGDIDHNAYAEFRETQKEKAAARRKELEEQERKRELAAADEEESKEPPQVDSDDDADAKTDNANAETPMKEKSADGEASDEKAADSDGTAVPAEPKEDVVETPPV
ncbi:MAG: IRE (iron responsive element) [Pirellulaceae bacterium]|nr:IRE (iron responsive element) [Pirellulaceae bacterium]